MNSTFVLQLECVGLRWHLNINIRVPDDNMDFLEVVARSPPPPPRPLKSSSPLQPPPPPNGDRHFTVLLGNIYCDGLCCPSVTHSLALFSHHFESITCV